MRKALADNFIAYSNNTFLEMHKHHPSNNFLSSDFRQTTDLFQIGAELHLLQKNRRKYRKHSSVDYFNINGVRNKIADLQVNIRKFTCR